MGDDIITLSFICVGPQRTASSWLDRSLRPHPQICMPGYVKETFFFDKNYKKGFDWYRKMFRYCSGTRLYGEVGPTYFESSIALDRIKKHNCNVKIIILIRNPIARTYSSYCHEYSKGRVGKDFFKAITKQPRIVESGRYSVLVPMWQSAFGNSNVLFLLQEDIQENPQGQINNLYGFLEIDSFPIASELTGVYGERTTPQFWLLAALFSRVARGLRNIGLHRFVEFSKKLGFKSIYRGGNPLRIKFTYQIYNALMDAHINDIDFIEKQLEKNFSKWTDPTTYGL